MSAARLWDVIVVGAGPAGSTVSALLARAGHRVVVLEKEQFPRFHIGESLLPAGLPVQERLGMTPQTGTAVYKGGAEFVCEESGRARTFRFADALPGCPDHAHQVERARFDAEIRDRAVAFGAELRHGEKVEDVAFESDRVRVRTASGTEAGRYFIDATGQDRLLAGRSGTAEPYRDFGSAAAFTHFEGLSDDTLQEIGPMNDIRIMLRPEGWGWIIPLAGRRLSVGIVGKGRISPEKLEEGLLAGPLATRWTAGCRRQATRVARNFSYRNTAPSGPRFAAIGDAACFLDPVFSSGVTLAMRGAEDLADRLGPALEAGTEAAPDLLAAHHASMDRAYRTFAGLIDRFYNTRFAQTVFLEDSMDTQLRRGVLSVLAGDVWRTDNPFQDMLLQARRRGGVVPA